MNSVVRHASVLRRIASFDGHTAVEFLVELSDYDETDDTFSNPRMSSVKGHAVELENDPNEYDGGSLTKRTPVTLLFIPNVIGERPALDSIVMWDSIKRVTKKVHLLRPYGSVIGAKVIAL